MVKAHGYTWTSAVFIADPRVQVASMQVRITQASTAYTELRNTEFMIAAMLMNERVFEIGVIMGNKGYNGCSQNLPRQKLSNILLH